MKYRLLIWALMGFCINPYAKTETFDVSTALQISSEELPKDVVRQLSIQNYGAVLYSKQIQLQKDAFSQLHITDKPLLSARKNKVLVGQFVDLPLVGKKLPVRLYVEQAQMLIENRNIITYTGSIEDHSESRFVVSVEDGMIFGEVRLDGLVYKLHTTTGKKPIQIMSLIDPKLMPKDTSNDVSDPSANQVEKTPTNKSAGSNGNVRVLFLYASNVSNPHAKIANLIADFNQIKAASGVPSNRYISSAGTQMVNSTFTDKESCKEKIIKNMKHKDKEFVNLNADMQTAFADVAFLIIDGPSGHNSCFDGYPGHVGGQAAGALIKSLAYGVSADNYLGSAGDYTGVHEIGHILGGLHPQAYDGSGYHYGIIENANPAEWQSMMGGYTESSGNCPFTGIGSTQCLRIPYFSNPNRTYNGKPLGAANANMTLHLDYSMSVASNWQPDPPPPTTPTGLTVTSEKCYGLNQISWNPVANVDEYKLYRAGYTGPVLVYSGNSTETWVVVSTGGWALWLEACNGSGCSASTSSVYASYTNYCM